MKNFLPKCNFRQLALQDWVRVRDDVGDAGALLRHRAPLEALHHQEVPPPGHRRLRGPLQRSESEPSEIFFSRTPPGANDVSFKKIFLTKYSRKKCPFFTQNTLLMLKTLAKNWRKSAKVMNLAVTLLQLVFLVHHLVDLDELITS
jgi:hypothetical protein